MGKITKIFQIYFIFGFIFLVCISYGGSDSTPKSNDITKLNTLEIIRKFGYPAESHKVKTADGYILEMHRIPNRHSNHKTAKKKPPIFLHHGLFGTSTDFFMNSTKFALPFLLSDLGFDVWLTNARGNTYSRAHVSLSPDDLRFWNFSWHETAVYDIPAQIDFICDHTKQEKIIFLGYSLGTTVFFVLTSMRPEYNDKIEVAILWAVTAYMKHAKSPFLRFLVPFSGGLNIAAKLLTDGEFLPRNPVMTRLSRIACTSSWAPSRLCMSPIFLLVGYDPNEFNLDSFSNVLSLYPQGYSSKAVNHYTQLVKSGRFRQYDYGIIGNYRHYRRLHPPDYDVSATKIPMYFYQAKNDYMSDMKDVERLIQQLHTLRKIYMVEHPLFSHLDFITSLDPKKYVYDEVIKDLMSYLNDVNG